MPKGPYDGFPSVMDKPEPEPHMDVSVARFLLDPRIFNYVILTLYMLNALRWAMDRRWADVCYWISAFMITATVTWGYRHS